MTKKIRLTLDDFEYRILINALNDMRNRLLREGRCTEDINELMLKIIDAPIKRAGI